MEALNENETGENHQVNAEGGNSEANVKNEDNGTANFEADASDMLQMFIYDYLKRHGCEQSAEAFRAESQLLFEYDVSEDHQHGFLSDSWMSFWPAFYERATRSHFVPSYVDQILDQNQKMSLDPQNGDQNELRQHHHHNHQRQHHQS